jgi:alkylglycerol monooxygenase
MNLILYAIPFFFLLMLLEFIYGVLRKRNTYRINDTINSLSLGSLSRLQGLVVLGFSGLIYEFIVARYQLTQLADDQLWVWLSCFVLYDLAYYWKHRYGHEIALFWGSHVAHHQSEDYNLSTALRQTSIDFYGFLFYLPFFVLGYPAEILFTVVSMNLIYQFWVHTEHVPKLGILEWVFVTPSNHRVHHARNKIYVDRNYGGVFILWDRLFGSFQDELESEVAVFGLRKPLNSWNPVWANVHVYWRLLLDCVKAPSIANKIKICFKPPGWLPDSMQSSCKLRQQETDLSSRFDPALSNFEKAYCCVQFLITVGLSLTVIVNINGWSYVATSIAVIYLTYCYYVHGRWLESRSNAVSLEGIRLILLLGAMPFIDFGDMLQGTLMAFAAASLIVLLISAKRKPIDAVI